jgi:hypothetical protein
MSTVNTQALLSTTNDAVYGAGWNTVYDAMNVPQIWQELVKYYGPNIGLLEFAVMQGATVPIAGPTKTVWEEGSLVKLVKLNGEIAITAEGDNITFSLDADEFSANHNCYLAVHDQIVIPAYYIEEDGAQSIVPAIYQVLSVDDVTLDENAVWTAFPTRADTAIAIAVPDGTELMVKPGNYANGVDSGTSKSAGWYSRTFKTSTVKADMTIEGSIQSNEKYYEKLKGGGTGIFSKASIEMDFLLSKAINDEIFMGQGVTNVITQATQNGDLNTITGTVGLLRHMAERANLQYYTTAYQSTDFDDVKDILTSQGVADRNVAFLMGSTLYKFVENSNLDFIKEYSGGTDLMKTFAQIQVAFQAVKKNGVFFTFKELPSLSDPTSYGAAAFDGYHKELGFILPDVEVTVRGSMESPETTKLKNFTLGFKRYNGEDRTRIIKDIPGMANPNGGGGIAINTFDDYRMSGLSEFMVLANRVNQWTLVLNDSIL